MADTTLPVQNGASAVRVQKGWRNGPYNRLMDPLPYENGVAPTSAAAASVQPSLASSDKATAGTTAASAPAAAASADGGKLTVLRRSWAHTRSSIRRALEEANGGGEYGSEVWIKAPMIHEDELVALPFQPPTIWQYLLEIVGGTWELVLYVLVMLLAIMLETNVRYFRAGSDYDRWWVYLYKVVVVCYPAGIMVVQFCLLCEYVMRKYLFFRLLSLGIMVQAERRPPHRSWFFVFFVAVWVILNVWAWWGLITWWGRNGKSGPEYLSFAVMGVVNVVAFHLLMYYYRLMDQQKRFLKPLQAYLLPEMTLVSELVVKQEMWRALRALVFGFCWPGPTRFDVEWVRQNGVRLPRTYGGAAEAAEAVARAVADEAAADNGSQDERFFSVSGSSSGSDRAGGVAAGAPIDGAMDAPAPEEGMERISNSAAAADAVDTAAASAPVLGGGDVALVPAVSVKATAAVRPEAAGAPADGYSAGVTVAVAAGTAAAAALLVTGGAAAVDADEEKPVEVDATAAAAAVDTDEEKPVEVDATAAAAAGDADEEKLVEVDATAAAAGAIANDTSAVPAGEKAVAAAGAAAATAVAQPTTDQIKSIGDETKASSDTDAAVADAAASAAGAAVVIAAVEEEGANSPEARASAPAAPAASATAATGAADAEVPAPGSPVARPSAAGAAAAAALVEDVAAAAPPVGEEASGSTPDVAAAAAAPAVGIVKADTTPSAAVAVVAATAAELSAAGAVDSHSEEAPAPVTTPAGAPEDAISTAAVQQSYRSASREITDAAASGNLTKRPSGGRVPAGGAAISSPGPLAEGVCSSQDDGAAAAAAAASEGSGVAKSANSGSSKSRSSSAGGSDASAPQPAAADPAAARSPVMAAGAAVGRATWGCCRSCCVCCFRCSCCLCIWVYRMFDSRYNTSGMFALPATFMTALACRKVWPFQRDVPFLRAISLAVLMAALVVAGGVVFGGWLVARNQPICQWGLDSCADCLIYEEEYVQYDKVCTDGGYEITKIWPDPDYFDPLCPGGRSWFTNGVWANNNSEVQAQVDVYQNITGKALINGYLAGIMSYYAYSDSFEGLQRGFEGQFIKRFKSLFTEYGMMRYEFIFQDDTAIADTQFIVAGTGKDVYMIFRGTDSLADALITDLSSRCVTNSDYGAEVCVHKGFLSAYRQAQAEVYKALLSVINGLSSVPPITNGTRSWDPSQGQPFSLWLTGHSLGGALATLCAMDLRNKGIEISGVFTYGSPRVGDTRFRDLYGKYGLDKATWRYMHRSDAIPQVPPKSFGFVHVTPPYMLADGRCTIWPNEDTCASSTFLGTCSISPSDHYIPGYLANLRSCVAASRQLRNCTEAMMPLWAKMEDVP